MLTVVFAVLFLVAFATFPLSMGPLAPLQKLALALVALGVSLLGMLLQRVVNVYAKLEKFVSDKYDTL